MRPDSTRKPPEKRSSDWRPKHTRSFYTTANQLCEIFSQPLPNREHEVLTLLLFEMARHMLAQRGAGQLAKYLYLAIGNSWQFYRKGLNIEDGEHFDDAVNRQTVDHHVRLLYALEVILDDPGQSSHRQYSNRSVVEEVDRLLQSCRSDAATSRAKVVDIAARRYRARVTLAPAD